MIRNEGAPIGEQNPTPGHEKAKIVDDNSPRRRGPRKFRCADFERCQKSVSIWRTKVFSKLAVINIISLKKFFTDLSMRGRTLHKPCEWRPLDRLPARRLEDAGGTQDRAGGACAILHPMHLTFPIRVGQFIPKFEKCVTSIVYLYDSE
ncbi:Hypothetical protein NTJ_11961 [Nesidiocoris tenuis]|uniref:Uncharacterized protein n=1 Tax=Nesidiocoris tenuis TaxID=355587 RepID=A0ABN7B420_9HEMI|nr:Hypothetical protein NTJ_11961 [Nesidiocoris tenuis]